MYFRGLTDSRVEVMTFKRQVAECAEAIEAINNMRGYAVKMIKIGTPTDASAVLLVDVDAEHGMRLDDLIALRDVVAEISVRFTKVNVWNNGRLVIG